MSSSTLQNPYITLGPVLTGFKDLLVSLDIQLDTTRLF